MQKKFLSLIVVIIISIVNVLYSMKSNSDFNLRSLFVLSFVQAEESCPDNEENVTVTSYDAEGEKHECTACIRGTIDCTPTCVNY
jgi:uncharacterized protein YxeA